MPTTVQEIYTKTIYPLRDDEKLQLATLILEDVTQSKRGRQISPEDREIERQKLRAFAGSVSSGNPHSSDNEQIDKDLALEYLNTHEDEN